MKIRIESEGDGPHTTVWLDGEETQGIASLDLSFAPDRTNWCWMAFARPEIVFEGESEIHIEVNGKLWKLIEE